MADATTGTLDEPVFATPGSRQENWRRGIRRFRQNTLSMVGLSGIILLCIIAYAAYLGILLVQAL